MNKRVVIAHYNEAFFEKSETFIYNYISHFKSVKPILFALKFLNFDLFPFLNESCYQLPASFPLKYSFSWLKVKICQKFLSTCFTAEEFICRKQKVRLIHAHFGPQGFRAVNWFELRPLPVITSFYGYDVSELPNDPVWAKRLKILFEKGRMFLVEGNVMRSKLIAIGCPEEKIRVQRIAIPLDKLAFKERLPKNSGEKAVFLFCGRFVEKKGLRYTIEAFGELKKTNPNFEFRVIGDGPLKEDIQNLVKKFGLKEHVTFLGFLNYQQYIDELDRADIFIHPSVTSQTGDSEGGAPTVILEAQAMGLPVVSTYHADIPNIVKDKESALLSNERDVPGLVSNILEILLHQDRWAQMGRAGRAFVEEFHDIQKEVNSLEDKYFEALGLK